MFTKGKKRGRFSLTAKGTPTLKDLWKRQRQSDGTPSSIFLCTATLLAACAHVMTCMPHDVHPQIMGPLHLVGMFVAVVFWHISSRDSDWLSEINFCTAGTEKSTPLPNWRYNTPLFLCGTRRRHSTVGSDHQATRTPLPLLLPLPSVSMC